MRYPTNRNNYIVKKIVGKAIDQIDFENNNIAKRLITKEINKKVKKIIYQKGHPINQTDDIVTIVIEDVYPKVMRLGIGVHRIGGYIPKPPIKKPIPIVVPPTVPSAVPFPENPNKNPINIRTRKGRRVI